jgi:hypothetical protein
MNAPRLASHLLRLFLLATLMLGPAAPSVAAAPPHAGLSPVVPVLSIFSALAARNRNYRTAEEFIQDRNAYYDSLRATARKQLLERDISTLRPSQVAAYIKLVAAIEQERAGTLAVAESFKKATRQEFQHDLQGAITSALLGSGPAQRLVSVLKSGIHSAKDAIDAAIKNLSGESGGAFAEVAKVKRVAERVKAVASNIGGPTGAALRKIASSILKTTDKVDLIEADLQKAASDLDDLLGNVSEVERVQQAVTGSFTTREAGIYVLTGQTDNPVLDAIVTVLQRGSSVSDRLKETARAKLQAGFSARCVAQAKKILEAMAELGGGQFENLAEIKSACRSLEDADEEETAATSVAQTATQAAQQTAEAAATATESARQTEEAVPPPPTDFSGSWHSDAACNENESPYRWTVTLQQDAEGHVTGEITFHKCPGGGRAEYSVTGQATPGDTLTLEGKKNLSLGGLGGSAPGSVTFTIQKGGPPDPNLAP